MTIRQDNLSRFKEADFIRKDGIDTFGLWVRPTFLIEENLEDEDIIKVNIDQSRAGRPDQIANEFYGTPLLEWVVVMFNRPLNTLGWPQAGTVIKIPTRITVFRNF